MGVTTRVFSEKAISSLCPSFKGYIDTRWMTFLVEGGGGGEYVER